MKQRAFGNTGINVSPIGLGTVKLGRDQGVKYPNDFTIPDDNSAQALIDQARDLGINLIDTAPAYGISEQRLGPLLAGQRQHWVICSKVGEDFDSGESSFNFSADHTRFSIERSLQRLQTDFIDIVLVHSDGNDIDIIEQHEVLQELARCKQEGLIRAYGMSTKTVDGGLAAAAATDAVMATYNLEYRDEAPVIDYCQQKNKGLLIKKAFASGHLCLDGEDPVQQSMDFIFSHPGISSAIVGTINPAHLIANVQAVEKALRPSS
ncbi:MAG: aryl-alcohol dehydrogenase-like predicted oxidoreductase [Oceanicoccus sp.]|jgi:aryl-alcohol dehydrogenase-like predicted oxidoreductase